MKCAAQQTSAPKRKVHGSTRLAPIPGLTDGAGTACANDTRSTIAGTLNKLLADAPTFSVEPTGSSKSPAPTLHGTGSNVFHREGEYWTIIYEGEVFRLKDTKGLRYLSELLHNPGREFHAIELISAVHDSTHTAATGSFRGSDLPIGMDCGQAGNLLDWQARSECRTRLEDLRQELEGADRFNNFEGALSIRQEIEFITQELVSAVGPGGRYRKAGSPAERATHISSMMIMPIGVTPVGT